MSEPIRVLQVFAQMNRGGAETMIMNLYRHIDRLKVQFDFIVHTKEKCAYDDEIEALGGKIYRVPRYNGKNLLQYRRSWKEIFNEHQEYKIIHGHVRSTASIYLKIAKKYGIITIAHSHNTSSGNGFSAVIKNVLQLPIRYTADYLFACSVQSGIWLFGNRACKNSNFYILNNAITAKDFIYSEEIRNEKRKELKIEDKLVIGHIGRFLKQKNHIFLIDIFKEIHKGNDNSVLLLVGGGELRSVIEKEVKKLGLDNFVFFTGVRSDVPELLQAMDVFVFPSLFEGLPVVIIEAQATGLRCVIADTISDDACLTDLVVKVLLKSPAEAWADRILRINDGYKRTSTYSVIKSKGYDIDDTSLWLEAFYLRILTSVRGQIE